MASASTVENNEDLLTEILLRLPVKSLMRFRCVSKRWQSQISNPFFPRSHTLHHYTPFPSHLLDTNVHTTGHSSFITMPSSDNNVSHNPMITDFRFLNLPHSIFIIQSCNGLLLLRVGHYPNSVYYVCNPITKRFLALHLPTALGRDEAEVVYLSFEPLRSSHYKVILMRFEHETDTTSNWHIDMINVYSSNTGCWTDFGFFQPPLQVEGSFEFKGTYCNGVIYWHCNNEESMYCDVENQCFGTFPMPCDGQFELADVLYFGESGGRLHMILRQSDRTYFDIFELREDLSEWSARFRVDLDGLFGNYFVVMCFFRRVKVEDSMLVFLMRRQVMLYNLSDCTCKRLVDFNHSLSPLVKLLVDSPTVLQYSASLSWDGDSSAF